MGFKEIKERTGIADPAVAVPTVSDTTEAMYPYGIGNFKDAKKHFEKAYLQQKLHENDGNISQTAEHVGMERSHLHKKLNHYKFQVRST